MVIFVGDGMGVQTVTMSRIYKGQKRVKTGEAVPGEDVNGEGAEMVWESFPSTGLSKVKYRCLPYTRRSLLMMLLLFDLTLLSLMLLPFVLLIAFFVTATVFAADGEDD